VHNLCPQHKTIALELYDRGYPHIVRNLCDEVIDLLRNIKTFDPRNVSNDRLRDDWRICKAWLSTLNKGKKFTSNQFKEYSLERQKQIVRRLAISIRAEMKRRGWKPSEKKLGVGCGTDAVRAITGKVVYGHKKGKQIGAKVKKPKKLKKKLI